MASSVVPIGRRMKGYEKFTADPGPGGLPGAARWAVGRAQSCFRSEARVKQKSLDKLAALVEAR